MKKIDEDDIKTIRAQANKIAKLSRELMAAAEIIRKAVKEGSPELIDTTKLTLELMNSEDSAYTVVRYVNGKKGVWMKKLSV